MIKLTKIEKIRKIDKKLKNKKFKKKNFTKTYSSSVIIPSIPAAH